jgi:hypothetical protein
MKNKQYYRDVKQIHYGLRCRQPFCVELSRVFLPPASCTDEEELEEAIEQEKVIIAATTSTSTVTEQQVATAVTTTVIEHNRKLSILGCHCCYHYCDRTQQ